MSHCTKLSIAICLVLAFIAFVLQAQTEELKSNSSEVTLAQASSELTKTYGELKNVYEAQLELKRHRFQSQIVPYIDVINAEIDLIQTEIRIAEYLGEKEQVIQKVRKLISLREKVLKQTQMFFKMGQAESEDVHAAKINVLEAKISLHMAVLK